jgi:hypothetical protein
MRLIHVQKTRRKKSDFLSSYDRTYLEFILLKENAVFEPLKGYCDIGDYNQ